MPYASTQLGRLFVQSSGQNKPVTFWPCLFGDSSIYRACIEDIRHDHQVVLVDGPSHGRSDPWPKRFSLTQCADAWVQALDHFGVTEPAVFCGLSWGSMVALRVALRHPHRVRGLFLMSTSALASRRRFVPQFLALSAAVGAFGFPDWLIRMMASAMVSPKTLRSSPHLVHDMLSRSRHLDRRALYLASMSILVRRSSFVQDLWRIRTPARIVVGEHDRLTPVRAGRIVANAIEGARLEVLEGVGHLPSLEAPEQVKSLLRVALDDMG